MSSLRKDHWEKVYQSKKPQDVSWYQDNPSVSLEMVASTGIGLDHKIIDVGSGASVLVDKLLEKGFRDISVLDISAQAIRYAQERLGGRAERIKWIEADITEFIPPQLYDLWHDRAVFHFLTAPDDRKKYIEVMKRAVRPGGYVVIATFALQGPLKCSGLDVQRYDAAALGKELGTSFHLIKSLEETHLTPWQAEQKFIYVCFRKEGDNNDA